MEGGSGAGWQSGASSAGTLDENRDERHLRGGRTEAPPADAEALEQLLLCRACQLERIGDRIGRLERLDPCAGKVPCDHDNEIPQGEIDATHGGAPRRPCSSCVLERS